MTFETILVETRGRVGLVTLNRPKALNALNSALIAEVSAALDGFEADAGIGAVVLTGSEKAFAAGADIKEMASLGFPDTYTNDFLAGWDRVARFRKPIVAAVAGFALGGGCELAMACDTIYAAQTAKFGQPEIRLGIMPGAGGTQRLTRAVGKAKAIDLILTGRTMDADEAERSGLVARVLPAEGFVDAVVAIAAGMAELSLPATMMAKEAIGRGFETSLAEGLRFERRLFQAMFATDDQKEGMAAFVEKRPAVFRHR